MTNSDLQHHRFECDIDVKLFHFALSTTMIPSLYIVEAGFGYET